MEVLTRFSVAQRSSGSVVNKDRTHVLSQSVNGQSGRETTPFDLRWLKECAACVSLFLSTTVLPKLVTVWKYIVHDIIYL